MTDKDIEKLAKQILSNLPILRFLTGIIVLAICASFTLGFTWYRFSKMPNIVEEDYYAMHKYVFEDRLQRVKKYDDIIRNFQYENKKLREEQTRQKLELDRWYKEYLDEIKSIKKEIRNINKKLPG